MLVGWNMELTQTFSAPVTLLQNLAIMQKLLLPAAAYDQVMQVATRWQFLTERANTAALTCGHSQSTTSNLLRVTLRFGTLADLPYISAYTSHF